MGTAAHTIPQFTITEAQEKLEALVQDVARQDTRMIVEKPNGAVAVLIALKDLRRLVRLDEMDGEAREVVAAMRAAFADVPDEEIERQRERIKAEIREENRGVRAEVVSST